MAQGTFELKFKKKWELSRRKVLQVEEGVAHEKAQRNGTVSCIQGTTGSLVRVGSELEGSGENVKGGR